MVVHNFKQVRLTEEEMFYLKQFAKVVECPDRSIKCDICPFCVDNWCMMRKIRNIVDDPKMRVKGNKDEQIKEKISTNQL